MCCATLTLVVTLEGQDQRPRHDASIEFLETDAASLPPEFEADVLIRLSQLSKVDRAWRLEMLDTAYMRAYAAEQAPPLHQPADPGRQPAGRAALRAHDGAHAFTLQLRAVR
jgi:hypothetical protein